MEYLAMWLITIIISYGIEFINKLKLFKDTADNGYRIKLDVFKNIKMKNDNADFGEAKHLIPIFNVFISMFDGINIFNNANKIINDLMIMGCLEKMSIDELEKYKKHPTELNAYYMSYIANKTLYNAKKIIIPGTNGEKNSVIYYVFDQDFNLDIVKVRGPLERKSKKEQLDILTNYMFETAENIFAKLYGTYDDFVETESPQRKKINELKSLKNKLLRIKDQKTQDNDLDNQKIYRKKK